MLCAEFRVHQRGIEQADSYVFNPHKWLFTNFDCNVFWVADRAPLIGTLSILPPYLRNAATESGDVIDYRDWHVPLGPPLPGAEALVGAAQLRRHGPAPLTARARALAQGSGERVDEHPALARIAPVSFGLVCFRHVRRQRRDGRARGGDQRGRQRAGHAVDDRRQRFLRVAVGATATTERDVERLWSIVAAAV